MAVRPCCQCNSSNAKYICCSCARSKTTCTSCHPSWSGRCQNVLRSTQVPSNILSNQAPSLTVTLTATCPPESPNPVSSLSNQQPGDALHSLSLVSLPSLFLISRVHVFTLHHVPKGASDTWSGLITTELNSILSSPLDMNSWCKFMMLAKCTLFNPSSWQFLAWHVKNCQRSSKALVWGWLCRSLGGGCCWRIQG